MVQTFFRLADSHDRAFLVAMVAEASNWDGQAPTSVVDVEADPALAHYVSGWQRPSDFGVVATDGDGEPIGAAWARQFTADDPGYGFVDASVPEISMGVVSTFRGQGVGTDLLAALITEAQNRGFATLSLSVADGNRARAIYERAGFVRHDRNESSGTMTLIIAATAY